MDFYNSLINSIRNININNKPKKQYVFGSIVSGTYTNWKHDPHPTILCFGNYLKNNKWYLNGIQLHALNNSSLLFLLSTIKNLKLNGNIASPVLFFNYLKYNANDVIYNGYRTYLLDMCNFKIVNPGFSNIGENYCYPISDKRDEYIINYLSNDKPKIINYDLNSQALRENITMALNTVKIW